MTTPHPEQPAEGPRDDAADAGPTCDHCGNRYDKAFTVRTHDGRELTFDAFECAIAAVAPQCGHCGCRIIGHGVEVEGTAFCCSHCARGATGTDATDRHGA